MVAPHEGNGSVAAEADAAQRAWQPDLRYIKLGTGTYYLLVFLDAFGRFVTYWGLLRWVDGETVSLSALSALETVPRAERAQIQIQRNNGSAFVSADFARILRENRVTHARIHPLNRPRFSGQEGGVITPPCG